MLQFLQRIWLPRALPELAVWFANFALKFEQFAAALGLAAEIPSVQQMNATVQWLNDAIGAQDANTHGLRQFRDLSLFATEDDPAPVDPVTTLPAPPAEFSTSVIHRLVDLVEKKILTADNYSGEIGVQLGVIPSKGEKPSPETVKPNGKYTPAGSGYEMAVVVSQRGEADMWACEARTVGQEEWKVIKTATGKSADVTLEAGEPGKPLQIQARIQLYRNNKKYGQVSDAVYVTLNP